MTNPDTITFQSDVVVVPVVVPEEGPLVVPPPRDTLLQAQLSRVARENERLHHALGLLNRAHARTLKRLRDKATDHTILREAAAAVVATARGGGSLADLVATIEALARVARLDRPRCIKIF